MDHNSLISIGGHTKFIISTSGRQTSISRYNRLLHEILKVDIAYLPINSGDPNSIKIDPQKFIYALKGMPCIGGAISRDVKYSIIPYLDDLDDLAAKIKSVNTVIVQEDGKLKGYNTDALGFRKAIIDGIEKSGIEVKSAVCYGYGGVASVVSNVLQEMGIKTYITGRNLDSAKKRAIELGIELWDGHEVQLFINATPASDYPLNYAKNLLEPLSACQIAFDHEMPGKHLADYCKENDIYHIEGVEMYYPQMFAQWSLFLKGLVDENEIPQLIHQAEKPNK